MAIEHTNTEKEAWVPPYTHSGLDGYDAAVLTNVAIWCVWC